MAAANVIIKTVRLKEDVVSQIEAKMERENRNFSNMVETMLMIMLQNEDKIKTGSTVQ